jgi:hypothetical protein
MKEKISRKSIVSQLQRDEFHHCSKHMLAQEGEETGATRPKICSTQVLHGFACVLGVVWAGLAGPPVVT